ncbi:hypothetical protein MnTg04_00088 [bacterium MnTg04]|nr:hypothetical protein MnTg04_00088 [bacterium MnTg04]
MTTVKGVLQGVVLQCHGLKVFARGLHGLLNGDRHFARLAITKTDPTLAIADHGQRGEPELTATFDNLGDAVNRYQLFNQVVAWTSIKLSHMQKLFLLKPCPTPNGIRTPGRPRGRHRPAP